jgi:hypothetical protein
MNMKQPSKPQQPAAPANKAPGQQKPPAPAPQQKAKKPRSIWPGFFFFSFF